MWRTSSHSNANGGQCVQIALVAADVRIRDSKTPELGYAVFSPAAMSLFLSHVRSPC
ncbi:DUF397 domain-containing protein [Embleya sp. NBC_00896]|uniref:DUF397 domain-containing protein n=1 Tax=Embleya sp. NBC_00896 TaxID=2975961 RepID=UPI00386561BA